MSTKGSTEDDRLPPPAFPPGGDRRKGPAAESSAADVPEEAFISPDEPIRRVSTLDEAFISPDDPIVRQEEPHTPEDFEQVMGADEGWENEVFVTGIGDDPHLVPAGEGNSLPEDPYVARLLEALRTLTSAVERKGEAGLRTTPSMSRFEATLRGYCVGFLAGLRDDPERVASRSED